MTEEEDYSVDILIETINTNVDVSGDEYADFGMLSTAVPILPPQFQEFILMERHHEEPDNDDKLAKLAKRSLHDREMRLNQDSEASEIQKKKRRERDRERREQLKNDPDSSELKRLRERRRERDKVLRDRLREDPNLAGRLEELQLRRRQKDRERRERKRMANITGNGNVQLHVDEAEESANEYLVQVEVNADM